MMLFLLVWGAVFAQETPDPPAVTCCASAELTAQVKLYLKVQSALHQGGSVGEMTGAMYG